MTPEQQMRFATLRAKARAGELTMEEQREAIAILREDRVGASIASAKSRTTKATGAAKAAINSDDLLAELEKGMGL
jgi:hypothetical protein